MNAPDWPSHLSSEELRTATLAIERPPADTHAIRNRMALAARILDQLSETPRVPTLVIIKAPLAVIRAVPITDEMIVGRHSDCQLPVPEGKTMSRQHFHLRKADGLFIIKDLGSRNGTFINDPKTRLTQPRALRDGDMIFAGEIAFLFVNACED